MSGSKRYKDEFDKYAGAPAEFDSLFTFHGSELRAKKRIVSRKGSKGRVLGIAAAAAVMITAGAVLAAVSSGGMPTVGELSPGEENGETSTLDTAGRNDTAGRSRMAYEGTGGLSDETEAFRVYDRFDYSVTAELKATNIVMEYSEPARDDSAKSTLTSEIMSTADIILAGTVREKSYDNAANEIIYEVCISKFYSKADITPIFSERENFMTVHCPDGFAVDAYDELQIGSEYIMPVCIRHGEDEAAAELADPSGKCICKRGGNWEMDSDVYADFLEIINKAAENEVYTRADNGGNTGIVSDNALRSGLRLFLEESSRQYISQYSADDAETKSRTLSEVFNTDSETGGFESIRYMENDGVTDQTTLVLENENYFVLAPDMNGTVVYAGENFLGEKMIRIKTGENNMDISSVIFAGDLKLECAAGDSIYGQVLGSCGATPVYCRVIGSDGRAVEIIF